MALRQRRDEEWPVPPLMAKLTLATRRKVDTYLLDRPDHRRRSHGYMKPRLRSRPRPSCPLDDPEFDRPFRRYSATRYQSRDVVRRCQASEADDIYDWAGEQ